MTWGNDVVQWWASDEGWRVLTGAVIPGLAILVAGVIAALIARGSTKRLLKQHDRDALTSAVGAFVLAGRTAAEWHDHSDTERRHVDELISEAETRLRLLPIPGAALAANWASHQLESMKGHSSGFRFQAQQTLGDYRDALIAWSQKPRAAKKLFGADLERWRYETDDTTEPPAEGPPAPTSADASAEAAPNPSPGPGGRTGGGAAAQHPHGSEPRDRRRRGGRPAADGRVSRARAHRLDRPRLVRGDVAEGHREQEPR